MVTTFSQLKPISKKDRILVLLKDAIVSGQMQSGDAIVESRIAQQLGVGQPLVREALIELEHQGFVQRLPYRGSRVTELSWNDIEHIFSLRAELESIAAEWAQPRITPADLERLRKIVGDLKAAAADLDMQRFYEHDLVFHRALWELSGNKYLADALERVVAPLFAFFFLKTRRIPDSYERSAAHHEQLVEGLRTLPPGAVRQLVKSTLDTFREQWQNELLPDQHLPTRE